MDDLGAALEYIRTNFPEVAYRLDEPLSTHTSFRIGGPVRAMLFPGSAGELAKLLGGMAQRGVKPLVIGNGTNLLADDAPIDIIAIKTSACNAAKRTGENEITAEAGVSLAQLANMACEFGLAGLEFAHGIPGTLGGAVSMNAGAYGGELKDVVHSTEIFTPDAGISSLDNAGHSFTYRNSKLLGAGIIALSSVIRLKKGDAVEIKALMDDYGARRRESQPLDIPSAGSIFKRPKRGYAAELIENSGLKGYRIGGAQVSEKHAGFIINTGSATFSDVTALMEHIRETVLEQTGVDLEPEVRIVRRGLWS